MQGNTQPGQDRINLDCPFHRLKTADTSSKVLKNLKIANDKNQWRTSKNKRIIFLSLLTYTINIILRKADPRAIIVSKARLFQKDCHIPLSSGSVFTSVLKSLVDWLLVNEPSTDSSLWLHQRHLHLLCQQVHWACMVPFMSYQPLPVLLCWNPLVTNADYFLSMQATDFCFGVFSLSVFLVWLYSDRMCWVILADTCRVKKKSNCNNCSCRSQKAGIKPRFSHVIMVSIQQSCHLYTLSKTESFSTL